MVNLHDKWKTGVADRYEQHFGFGGLSGFDV
jgi:hypothetical protein